MFKVDVSTDGYNTMHFKFLTLEEAQNFASTLFAGIDAEKSPGLSVAISYYEIFEKEDKE